MKKTVGIVLVVVLITAGISCFLWEQGSYVAKVGNHKIKNHEYTFFLRVQKSTIEQEAGLANGPAVIEFWAHPVGGEDPVTIAMNQALENAKEFKIQLIKAEEAKFKLSDQEQKEIRDYLDYLFKNNNYVDYVKEYFGLTPSQFRDMTIKTGIIEGFIRDFKQKNQEAVSVSDHEVVNYYEEHKKSIDEVTLRQIFIKTDIPDLTEEEKKAKRELAEGLLQRIRQGEDMALLVLEYSEDKGVEDNAGVYTFTYTQALEEAYAPQFRDWAFKAEPGELDMIETDFGYHIMYLESKSSFNQKKETIINTIKEQKLNDDYYNQLTEWSRDPAFNLIKNENVLNKVTRNHIP